MMPPQPPDPVRDAARDGSATAATGTPRADRSCPACRTGVVPPRARYCSAACRQRAYRLRHATVQPTALATLAATLRYQRALVAQTVYECPTCEARLLGARRCPDCQVFCRRLGLGGPCPHCDEALTLAELLGEEVLPAR